MIRIRRLTWRIVHPEPMNGTDVEIKRKGWVTPYGFGDWQYPVSYEYACEQMKSMTEKMWASKPNNQTI